MNIKCYISSPGMDSGAVNDSKEIKRILRMTQSERGSKSIESAVGDLISKVFGEQLVQFCHFHKEASIMHLLVKMLVGLKVDMRPIFFGAPVYHTSKHINKLKMNLALPGLARSVDTKPDMFFKVFAWKSMSNAIISEGVGVNMWAVLLLASLMGSAAIHCKSSSRVATSIMSQLMRMAPAAATPGNLMPVRSFQEHNRTPDMVAISSVDRPDHFIRPTGDRNLAFNGTFTFCPVFDNCMPEDYLGCAYVLEMARYLKCKYHEVPPQNMYGHYQLIPNRYYHIHRKEGEHGGELNGWIIVGDEKVEYAALDETECGEGGSLDILSWQECIRKKGFLVMPMVFRQGALVKIGCEKKLGCLVNTGTKRSLDESNNTESDVGYLSNYNHFRCCYHALVEEGNLVPISVLDVMENLVNPGCELWIKPDTQAWENLSDNFPGHVLSQEDANLRMVKVRLNVPTVTVYI